MRLGHLSYLAYSSRKLRKIALGGLTGIVLGGGIAWAVTNVVLTLGGAGNICTGSVNDSGVLTITSCTIPIGSVTGGAPLASPTFTGVPAAPTAGATTNTTQIATTAMVQAAFAANIVPYAPLASPALTGTPTAPTASSSTNTTQIATTAMVQSAVTANFPAAYPVVLKSALPAVTSANTGAQAFVTDCRNTGEGAGVGTGCLAQVNKNGAWVATYNGATITN